MQSVTKRRGWRAATALSSLAVAAAVLTGVSPAHADDLNVQYDVNGVTHIDSTGSDITLGPAVMDSFVAEDGSFTGDMTLPGTRTEFKVLGFIPVTADVNFIPTKPTTGTLTRVGRYRTLQSSSSYYVRLSNIKAVGFPLFAGPNCRTSDPVVIDANTPEGEYFDIARGGTLTGTYSIGNFENCGLNTWLINQLVPGGGNTVELELSNGRLG